MNEILNLKNISQYFYQGKNKITVLNQLNLILSSSQKVAIIGSSGSGKTSLLNIISLMERPKTGSIFLSWMLGEVNVRVFTPTDLDNIVLIRSTVTPGTTKKLQEKYQNLRLVFNPEFLTERSANFDFINQTRYILGGDKQNTNKVADLYRWRFGDTIPVIETNYQTAELIKYMNNCFFATKVSFLNEMKQVSDRCEADWDMAVEGFIRDGRIGHSHMSVPGPDGKFGFGGKCFPKDVSAMISFGNNLGLDMHTLSGVWNTNCEVRPEKDWEDNDTGVAWVKEERKFTLKDVEMIQEAVRQHESDKE